MKPNYLQLCPLALGALAMSVGCSTQSYHGKYTGDHYLVSKRGTGATSRMNSEFPSGERRAAPVAVDNNASSSFDPGSIAPRIAEGISIDESALPPDAKPGECYTRVYQPPQYETVTERVVTQEPSERIDVLPAQYEWVEEQVLVQEEGERLEVIPAEFDWVEEKVLVTPATSKIEEVPAEYEWTEEEVLVKPAHKIWKKGRGLVEQLDGATGDIMCLIEVPAEYKTVRRQVLKSKGSSRNIQIPAEYTSVRKKVMTRPPQTRTVTIPSEYKTVKVKKLVKPEQRIKVPVPAQFETVSKQVVVSEGSHTWKRVLCETNLSPEIIMKVQIALKAAGYEPGPVDGKIGGLTHSAIETYQRETGLAVGGLTYETLKGLGIQL